MIVPWVDMPAGQKIKGRYELKENIGQGGMGVVYKAFDTEVGREVALKTIGDVTSRAALELFYKEWRVLANLHHPNIVEIFDIGEFQEGSVIKPFFVMPLLRGTTLDQLIRTPGETLSADRIVEIMSQLCRGLHAAHEHGLVHRDLKPSNVFVMEHNSVKLIDFGVAHLVGGGTKTGLKGTVWYMAPEQIQNQECTPAVDIFSLGVLCYEALTGVRPFQGRNAEEVFDAILHRIPIPASDVNPQVSQPISRVIHKAMAKHPRHRFTTALLFADTLTKAHRNEYIEFFDPAHVQPRIEKAVRAFEQGNAQLASDILTDIEAAGYIDQTLAPLRKQIDQQLRRKTIADLLDRARSGIAEQEFSLAAQNVEELLRIDPGNQEGLRLKEQLDQELGQKQIEESLRNAVLAINGHQYDRARQLLKYILTRSPGHNRALELGEQLASREQAYRTARQEKDNLYAAARKAWDNSEFESAYVKLKRVLELEEQAPDTAAPESRSNYLGFFTMVEAGHHAVEGAVAEYYRALQGRDFARAEQLCNENAGRYPGHALFEGLRLNLDEARAYYEAEMMSRYRKRALDEVDYETRLSILREAAKRYPTEQYFERAIHRLAERAEFAKAMIAKAREHEQQGRFVEACERWRMLKRGDPKYPGVDQEIERLSAKTHESGFTSAPLTSPTFAAAASISTADSLSAFGAPSTLAGGHGSTAAAAPATIKPAGPFPGPSPSGGPAIPPRPTGLPQGPKFSKALGAAIGAVLLVIAIIVAVVVWKRTPPTTATATANLPAGVSVPVSVQSATRGAVILINKQEKGVANPSLTLNLPPATYEIEAMMPGRKPWFDTLVVAAGTTPSVNVPALPPLAQAFRVITDFENGAVSLDGKKVGALKDSQYQFEDLPPGPHTLGIGDGVGGVVSIAFAVVQGAAPVVKGVSRSNLSTVVVSALGDDAKLYTNVPNARYAIDNGTPEGMPADGLQVKGAHDVAITSASKDPLRVRVENSPAATLTARLYSNRDIGTLVINGPGSTPFKVLLDGKERGGKPRDGKLQIAGLNAKQYNLIVRADGHEDFEQKVTITKGQESAITAVLKPISQSATLIIQGAHADVQVLIDGKEVGKTDGNGSFSYGSVIPAEHEISLRKAGGYKEVKMSKSFKPRSTVTISGGEVAMDKQPGIIEVVLTAGAKGYYKCSDGAEREMTQTVVTCKEGSATIRATKPGFDDDQKELTVAAGTRQTVSLSPKPRIEATRTRISCGPEQLASYGWHHAGDLYQSKGSAAFACTGRAGVYDFALMPPKGGIMNKKIQWAVPGAGRVVLDKKSVAGSLAKEDLKDVLQSDGSVVFRLDVSANRVQQSVKMADGSWKPIASAEASGGNSLLGPIKVEGDASLAKFSFNER